MTIGAKTAPEIYIIDTTLRDGEQAPGIVFSVKEKVTIARLLDRLGVFQSDIQIKYKLGKSRRWVLDCLKREP